MDNLIMRLMFPSVNEDKNCKISLGILKQMLTGS